MNLLAASVQYWADAEIVCTVPRKDFTPPPRVDSAVLKLTLKPSRLGNTESYYRFIKVVFAHPRKTIWNNLRDLASETNTTRDELTASYLAQEGIEYVQLLRDNAYLAAYQSNPATASSVAWSNFLSSLGAGTISYPAPNLGVSTTFTRTVQATAKTDKDEKIVSTVSWSFHNIQHSVTITDHLTPWQ